MLIKWKRGKFCALEKTQESAEFISFVEERWIGNGLLSLAQNEVNKRRDEALCFSQVKCFYKAFK